MATSIHDIARNISNRAGLLTRVRTVNSPRPDGTNETLNSLEIESKGRILDTKAGFVAIHPTSQRIVRIADSDAPADAIAEQALRTLGAAS